MMVPAVPKYVTQAAGNLADCPPGHGFHFYFPVWNERWEINKGAKTDALRQMLKLGSAGRLLDALNKRQQLLAEQLAEAQRCILDAKSTAPFATGLGLKHPIDNGFAFLTPYGLPYLAGSGIKGVVRRAAEELAWDDEEGMIPPKEQAVIEALFGCEDANNAKRGALSFWDVFPVPPKDELTVEIMTPHFGDYYQGKSTPNDAGKPNPIPFLAVPTGSKFRFVVTCETSLFRNSVELENWKGRLEQILEYAFDWLGFGAKTAVGYGVMEEDQNAREERERQKRELKEEMERRQKEAEKQAALAQLPLLQREIQEFLDARQDKNQPEISALIKALEQGRWSAETKKEVAGHLKSMMEKVNKWREKTEKKNPQKDADYQNTIKVMAWLEGK